jgi:hypothetical protein
VTKLVYSFSFVILERSREIMVLPYPMAETTKAEKDLMEEEG